MLRKIECAESKVTSQHAERPGRSSALISPHSLTCSISKAPTFAWSAQYLGKKHQSGKCPLTLNRTCWKPVSPGAQWGIPAVSRFPSNYIEMKQWAISRILISPIGAVQPCLLSCFAMRVCCCCYLLQPTVGLPRDNLLVEWANTITITAKTITTLPRTGCPCTGCPNCTGCPHRTGCPYTGCPHRLKA